MGSGEDEDNVGFPRQGTAPWRASPGSHTDDGSFGGSGDAAEEKLARGIVRAKPTAAKEGTTVAMATALKA